MRDMSAPHRETRCTIPMESGFEVTDQEIGRLRYARFVTRKTIFYDFNRFWAIVVFSDSPSSECIYRRSGAYASVYRCTTPTESGSEVAG